MSHEIVLEGPWLAPVVQRADTGNSIHRINHFPVDSELCFVTFICCIVIYLLDGVIHPLNNQALEIRLSAKQTGNCPMVWACELFKCPCSLIVSGLIYTLLKIQTKIKENSYRTFTTNP